MRISRNELVKHAAEFHVNIPPEMSHISNYEIKRILATFVNYLLKSEGMTCGEDTLNQIILMEAYLEKFCTRPNVHGVYYPHAETTPSATVRGPALAQNSRG